MPPRRLPGAAHDDALARDLLLGDRQPPVRLVAEEQPRHCRRPGARRPRGPAPRRGPGAPRRCPARPAPGSAAPSAPGRASPAGRAAPRAARRAAGANATTSFAVSIPTSIGLSSRRSIAQARLASSSRSSITSSRTGPSSGCASVGGRKKRFVSVVPAASPGLRQERQREHPPAVRAVGQRRVAERTEQGPDAEGVGHDQRARLGQRADRQVDRDDEPVVAVAGQRVDEKDLRQVRRARAAGRRGRSGRPRTPRTAAPACRGTSPAPGPPCGSRPGPARRRRCPCRPCRCSRTSTSRACRRRTAPPSACARRRRLRRPSPPARRRIPTAPPARCLARRAGSLKSASVQRDPLEAGRLDLGARRP